MTNEYVGYFNQCEIYDVNGNIHPDCALNQGHMGLKISSDQISKSNHEYENQKLFIISTIFCQNVTHFVLNSFTKIRIFLYDILKNIPDLKLAIVATDQFYVELVKLVAGDHLLILPVELYYCKHLYSCGIVTRHGACNRPINILNYSVPLWSKIKSNASQTNKYNDTFIYRAPKYDQRYLLNIDEIKNTIKLSIPGINMIDIRPLPPIDRLNLLYLSNILIVEGGASLINLMFAKHIRHLIIISNDMMLGLDETHCNIAKHSGVIIDKISYIKSTMISRLGRFSGTFKMDPTLINDVFKNSNCVKKNLVENKNDSSDQKQKLSKIVLTSAILTTAICNKYITNDKPIDNNKLSEMVVSMLSKIENNHIQSDIDKIVEQLDK